MSGYAAIHREVRDHPFFKGKPDRLGAWVWLILSACWKDTPFDVSGKMITLHRGQLCTSRNTLAREWNWSPSAVERFLTRLETEQMIGRATGQGRSVITISNYEKYQSSDKDAGQATGQATGQQSDKQRTTKEEGNKGIIEEPNGSSSPHDPPTAEKSNASKAKKFAMPSDWMPAKLPPDVAELVAQWPPGRLEQEVAEFRDYWIEDGTKRPGWDRTFRSRIRTIHNRVMRDGRNDRSQANRGSAPGGYDRRDGLERACDEIIGGDGPDHPRQPSGEAGRFDVIEGGRHRGG